MLTRYGIRTDQFQLLIWAGIGLACFANGLSAQQPADTNSRRGRSSGKSTPVAEDLKPTEDLVFLGADQPVFVRLFAMIDGQEIRTTRAERITKLLAEHDNNRDGAIDQQERLAHPRAFRSMGIPEKWDNLLPALDTSPKDELIKESEIASFVEDRFGPAVIFQGKVVGRKNQAVELFDLLDADHDLRLTESELSAIPTRLNKLDSDGDDAFSIAEVEPFRNPFGAAPNNRISADDLPWDITKTAAERLITRFDRSPKDNALSATELGQTEASIAAADADGNGTLSLEELKKWLQTVEPQFALTSNAFKRKSGRTEVWWQDLRQMAGPGRKLKRDAGKSLEVKVAGMPIQLQMTTAVRARQSDSVNFYKIEFRRADADKNKYLDKNEFSRLSALGASFEMLDADENDQIYENELVDYLGLESLGEQSRVILSVDRNEQSLFSLLDRNSDRRLTIRETLTPFDRLQPFDHDSDHVLNRSELSGTMRMTIQFPKPRLFQQDFNQANGMARDPIIQSRGDGPIWFQGMDRNLDGDVSRREFLGTEVQFRKWDRDGDGLISNTEAMDSEESAPRTTP